MVEESRDVGLELLEESYLSDPTGQLQMIDIEPIEHYVVEIPNQNPVSNIINKSRSKEDGLYAELMCDYKNGEDPVKFNKEMRLFFAK